MLSNLTQNINYEYCIIGSGPTGLTLAFLLSHIGKKCIIIDSMSSIGGCHRVNRIKEDGPTKDMFTEHSPRIYSNSYINFQQILSAMNINFFDIFTPYNFTISNIGGKTFSSLHWCEILYFIKEFFKLFFNKNHGRNIALEKFLHSHNFSDTSIDFIDRLCRLTDGSGIDRYTLYEFLNLANQQFFYKIYQPILPNDIGLFKHWYDFLINTGNVQFQLSTHVNNLNYDNNTNKITNIDVISNEKTTSIYAQNFILAIPPKAIYDILQNSNSPIIQNAFFPIETLKNFSIKSAYITDPAMTFHWDTKLDLPKVWGMPFSEWGIAFILLSDYMDFHDPRSLTVFSCCITRQTVKSNFTNKTADETTNKNDLLNEVFRQLKTLYPMLPTPTYSILSPTVYYKDSKWQETDSAFVDTYINKFMDYNSSINNLWNCGTQNGNSIYAFTSMESAVTNAMKLSHILEPSTKKFKIKSMKTLVLLLTIILYSFILVLCFLLYIKIRKLTSLKS